MSICPLAFFTIKDSHIDQSIDLDNDTVSFYNLETSKVIFTMDPDCKTFYHNANSEKKFIGKFGYTKDYFIKFTFDETTLKDFMTIDYPTKDFIKAEELFVKQMFKDYPDIFQL